ncbi:type II inositol-1,4,5-trisphosphate 5-phosphatase precursor, putative [Entamoeba invadens IP1]|uniref:Type II inositol-1,4,5-trisphosphate 5-phosphatase, putative n=1 Tax=Entamoeba invadens IP1 TaxID=370355 RepID=A0A0A1UET5_ENTIV|nr:type II inositol-1,4,5-trisphosphate 5-phosphatase precursor, putative [Entamoeba invadens IP1]ELP94993.1 type II inositol-1,4,5-trisphosphate 5-phosphatase precursor, putative [Entamoeba invadens IP1]|eukprot:XP_004261764.1 type II inositol-1,4,5-trisphosphate 5-phosphatase precursor, putative [Entamoeba invadens IP1]
MNVVPAEEIERYSEDPFNWRVIRLRERSNEYSVRKDYTVTMVTYNINEKMIEPKGFAYILDSQKEATDFLFIAVEEIDMSVTGFLKGSALTPKAVDLSYNVQSGLAALNKAKYTKLTVLQLGGVVLMGFCKEEIRDKVKEEGSGCEAVGAMGIMANKGGIAYSFKIHDTQICVVGAHLAAMQGEVEKRNSNFNDIFHNIVIFPINESAEFKRKTIESHDIVFWMGDLNYRLDEEDSVIREKIKSKTAYELVPEKDQLVVQRRIVPLLGQFTEAPINFLPTYKFVIGTQEYHEKRKPAYCDRVLFKCEKGLSVSCYDYLSKPDLIESDHKPVKGCFRFETRSIIPEKYKNVEKELVDMEDKLLKIVKPSVAIDRQEFTVEVYPYQRTDVVLLAQNDGNVKANVCIRDPKLEKSGGFPSWLKVTPNKFEFSKNDILPKSVTFSFLFDFVEHMEMFQKGEKNFLLVFEIQGGKTLFITFKIVLKKTCLCKSIEDLNKHSNGYVLNQPNSTNQIIPKEVWRLCGFIVPHLGEKNLFTTFPSEENTQSYLDILRALDLHEEFKKNTDVKRVIEFLAVFLMNLTESIIPSSLYDQVVLSSDKVEVDSERFFVRNKNQMPTCNYNLFVYMISFIKEVLKKNGELVSENVIRYFTHSFVRPADGVKRQCDARNIEKFLLKFV